MEEKQYSNPDDKLFSDREWARDEYGFKIGDSFELKRKEREVEGKARGKKVVFKLGEVQIAYPEAEKSKPIKLKKGIHQIGINMKWNMWGSVDGTHRTGNVVIGLIESSLAKKTIDMNSIYCWKNYPRIFNSNCYDTFTWTVDIENGGEYFFFITSNAEWSAIPIWWMNTEIVVV